MINVTLMFHQFAFRFSRPPVGSSFCLLGLKPENVARLARERLADRFERREADRARLAGLEDREVGQRHSDPIRELGQRHPPVVEQVVELDGDRHVRPSLRGLRA